MHIYGGIFVTLQLIFIPRHPIVVGYYGVLLEICVPVHPSVICPSIFWFPDDNFSKYQWIFTKLNVYTCIDIVEVWFGIAIGQIFVSF